MTVLVTGATGTMGTILVPRLVTAGYPVRVTSRRPYRAPGVDWMGADLASGAGVADAVDGVDTILHLASAPYRRSETVKVDVHGTERLATAAREAGVGHLIYLSIVGIDQIPWPYFRCKLAAEAHVRSSGAPWSILRATQFHQLVDKALRAMSRGPFLLYDRGIIAQPVDPRDVADRLIARVAGGPLLGTEELGGPEVLGIEAARQWLAARGKRRPILPIRLPGRLGAAFRAGHLVTRATPTGTISWSDYLAGR